jgi:hypothetical protein
MSSLETWCLKCFKINLLPDSVDRGIINHRQSALEVLCEEWPWLRSILPLIGAACQSPKPDSTYGPVLMGPSVSQNRFHRLLRDYHDALSTCSALSALDQSAHFNRCLDYPELAGFEETFSRYLDLYNVYTRRR